MSNIKIRKKGNGQINTFGIGRGNLSLNSKVILQSYARSFNGQKFDMSLYYNYIDDVNLGGIYPELSGPISESDIILYFSVNIHYFKVGDEVFIDSNSVQGLFTFEDAIPSISYANLGFGVGPYDMVYALNNYNNIIKKYLKFYPSSNGGFVVECYNDKPITLILGEFAFVYDNFNSAILSDYINTVYGSAYWCLNFNDTKTFPLTGPDNSYFLNNFMLPSYDAISSSFTDETEGISNQFSSHRLEKLN